MYSSLYFACIILFLSAALATVDVDPIAAVNSLHEAARDKVDLIHDKIADAIIPPPTNGEIIGDKDPEQPTGGLFGSLGLPVLPKIFSGLACVGSASLLSGQCDAPAECAKRGRVPDGKGLCLENNMCCVDTMKCGSISLLNNTIFSSPKYPQGTTQAGQCTMTVKKLGAHIKAVRVVLEDVQLSPPNANGNCNADGLWIEGVNSGSEIGRICGQVAGQHLYFPLGESTDDSIRVRVVLSPSSFQRRWLVRVVQVDSLSPSLPPPGCSQYFTGPSGVLTSFNANINNLTAMGNLAGLRYTICIRKEAGFCKLEFEPVFFSMGPPVSHAAPVATPVVPVPAHRLSRRSPGSAPLAIHRRPFSRPFALAPSVPAASIPHKIAGASYRPLLPAGDILSKLLEERLDAKLREYGIGTALALPHVGALSSPALPPTSAYSQPAVPAGATSFYQPTNEIIDAPAHAMDAVEGPAVADMSHLPVHDPMARVCAGQDVVVFPPPDDETSSIFCGSDFQVGRTLVTSSRPFVIRVNNKGTTRGQGFIIKYRHVIC